MGGFDAHPTSIQPCGLVRPWRCPFRASILPAALSRVGPSSPGEWGDTLPIARTRSDENARALYLSASHTRSTHGKQRDGEGLVGTFFVGRFVKLRFAPWKRKNVVLLVVVAGKTHRILEDEQQYSSCFGNTALLTRVGSHRR